MLLTQARARFYGGTTTPEELPRPETLPELTSTNPFSQWLEPAPSDPQVTLQQKLREAVRAGACKLMQQKIEAIRDICRFASGRPRESEDHCPSH